MAIDERSIGLWVVIDSDSDRLLTPAIEMVEGAST